jgi:hypothetical protein
MTLDLSGIPETHTLLLLTGWTDYAFSSDNVAAHQRGLSLEPPVLETRDESGIWRTALADVGIPVGRPQTIVWDLKNRSAGRMLRLRTNMRIYWDRIALAAPAGITLEREPLPRVSASLDERGFSAEASVDGRPPYAYDYERVSWPSPWKLMPGRYTRTGDVSRLVGETDDLFVVARPGDAVSLAFDASGLRATPAGWVRTFLLVGDGFSKEMDIHSASPDVAAPLPFHGMPSYPYPAEAAFVALRRNARLQQSYDTRRIERSLWPLELAAAPRPGTPAPR